MTTIACSRHEMACESRVSFSSGEHYRCDDKIVRIGTDIIGCAGTGGTIFAFLDWYMRRPPDRPEFSNENSFTAIVLNRSGIWFYDNVTFPQKVCEPFFTIGSGAMAAQAAMLCGKSPAEAVAVAIKCDKHSGGKIRNYRLKG